MYHHVIKWALTTSQTIVNHVKIKQYILRLASGNTAHPATATGAHLWNELHISDKPRPRPHHSRWLLCSWHWIGPPCAISYEDDHHV